MIDNIFDKVYITKHKSKGALDESKAPFSIFAFDLNSGGIIYVFNHGILWGKSFSRGF